MNQKTLDKLEFTKIVDMLFELASSPSGKNLCRKLKPMTEISSINTAQEQTAAAFTRIVKKGRLSFSGCRPVNDSLRRLEIGSSLSAPELLTIAKLLKTTAAAKTYGRHDTTEEPADCLDYYFEQLTPLAKLSAEIDRCILSEEEISDDASPKLRQIRRGINGMNGRIHSTLNSLLNGSLRSYLQDAIITMRGDRYCLPVKAEYRSQVNGMVHDQSATGSTLFIEPMSVVKLNNDLKELFAQEQEEIQVILARLSEETAGYIEEIRLNYKILTELDFIFAKGCLALDMNASRPVFNEDKRIRIREGRHPLLDKKKAVPISVTLGEDFDLLIITGPNTGGKTVSLKTVGLFTLMGQAGLHIPALDRSELSVFHRVFADIGDEQSIEQSLSTFSSHMTNIVSFLKNIDEQSLVLFDELGAGTDPTEGAALAIAILSCLHKRGIRTMATTHYSELKVFALSTPGVENACCEFDVETLSPTYHLLIGIPGKSNAFAISEKLGLPASIIADARTHLSDQATSFEDLLTDLEASRKTIEREKDEVAAYRREIERLKSELKSRQEKLDSQRDKILREANEKASAIVREAKDFADETMKNFRKFGKENVSAAEMEKERERIRRQLEKTRGSSGLEKSKPKKEHKASDFHLGDSVKVLSMNLNGTVNSLPDAKGNLFVQMGILRSQVHMSDLEILEEPAVLGAGQMRRTSSGKMKMGKSMQISSEINLLGKTVDEAIAELDKYLDDAYLAHLSPVRVVHGKGTGALRNGVHQYLRRQKHVKSFRLGAFGEGDAGVTIVEFK
ncbi:MAG: endonuclease MutS2 [Coprococcus sp.]|nr:endonuclease MutS2 [Coprococcus sp.]